MQQKFNPTISYIDLVFNLALAFVVLFIIAILMIQPIAKQGDITTKDSLLITMDWNEATGYDMDLHLQQADGNHISFVNRESLIASLERDDLGRINDVVGFIINREVIHIRKLTDGDYIVNVHFYANSQSESLPQNITVEFLQIEPKYEILAKKTVSFQLSVKEEVTLFSFRVVGGRVMYPVDVTSQYRIVSP